LTQERSGQERSGQAHPFDYGFFKYASKQEFLEKSKQFWNPAKTQFWADEDIDLVIDRREGYLLYDMEGRRLIDVHLNGGTYNLGHRNPELVATLESALERFDIGNHHFPALARTALAERLAEVAPGDLRYTVYASGGGEAVDIAIKTARSATGRRKIVSVIKAYHGHTGLAMATGDSRFTSIFLSDGNPDEFVQVPFNDLGAMEAAMSGGDVAAVLLETIPATYGFPMPRDGYLPAVRELCDRYGALYVADEVQTGLMRTGHLWAVTTFGVQPDIMVIGKGISGGLYPLGCVVVSERAAGWLRQDGFAHMSTFGGAELGCIVGLKVLEICERPEVASFVRYIGATLRDGLERIRAASGGFFSGIRQSGVVFGLEFAHPEGAMAVSRRLYHNGVWAIFSALDPAVLQFKPGILMTRELCEEVLDRLELSVQQAATAMRTPVGRGVA
jgi:acetylornithine/succinyldiaminopimelate/putrescine aminotransferase